MNFSITRSTTASLIPVFLTPITMSVIPIIAQIQLKFLFSILQNLQNRFPGILTLVKIYIKILQLGTTFAFSLPKWIMPKTCGDVSNLLSFVKNIASGGGYRAKPYKGCPLNLRVPSWCMSNSIKAGGVSVDSPPTKKLSPPARPARGSPPAVGGGVLRKKNLLQRNSGLDIRVA